MQQKKQFLSSIPSILAICLLKLKKIRRDNASYYINPEKPDVPLNKNDAFQKVQKRRVQEKR